MASSTIVGFVGIDVLSLQLAASLLESGSQIQVFEDAESTAVDGLLKLGGKKCATPMEAAKGILFAQDSVAQTRA